MAVALPAQNTQPSTAVFNVLANLTGGPYSGLAQGTDGNFYGTSFGSTFYGTAYQMTPAGTLTTIYNFCSQPNCADGYFPIGAPAALALGTDGNFYGTTGVGGAGDPSGPCAAASGGCGTIYNITPSGALTVLYNICSQPNCADGMGASGLVLGPDGNFYGAMAFGGANNNSTYCPPGCGTVFQITPAGEFTTTYNFCSQTNCSDGANPGAPLTVGLDGNLYGIAGGGGTLGIGAVFRLSLGGTLTVLHSFESGNADGACWHGCSPSLVQAPNGNLYGVTQSGGIFNPFLAQEDGVLFQVTG